MKNLKIENLIYKSSFLSKLNLFLFITFLILSIINVFYASFVQRGVVYDGTIWFLEILDKLSNNEWHIVFFFEHRTRCFVQLLNQLPINIFYHLTHTDSKNALAIAFSMPLFLFPFLGTLYNLLLSIRSKRFDIAVFALILYGIFIIPSSMYSVVEIFLASVLFFILFHYLIADIKYNFFDYVVIFFLTIISYMSSEVILYCGYLMFILSLYYAQESNKKIRYFIRYKWFLNVYMLYSI